MRSIPPPPKNNLWDYEKIGGGGGIVWYLNLMRCLLLLAILSTTQSAIITSFHRFRPPQSFFLLLFLKSFNNDKYYSMNKADRIMSVCPSVKISMFCFLGTVPAWLRLALTAILVLPCCYVCRRGCRATGCNGTSASRWATGRRGASWPRAASQSGRRQNGRPAPSADCGFCAVPP